MKKIFPALRAKRLSRPFLTPLQRQLLISGGILLFLVLGTTLVVLYGMGYRFGFTDGKAKLSKTGILNASSIPKGAQVYIDGHLTSATNNSVNLTPGKYEVTISKDGYYAWKKDILIKEQEVSNADATLFPSAPALQPISTFGVENPLLDPSGTKLAFRIASESAGNNPRREGIYVLDMTAGNFPVLAGQSSSTQIVSDVTDDFSKAQLTWSPDGEQLLASISSELRSPTYYLLNARSINDTPQDVTLTVQSILDSWKLQRTEKDQARLQALKPAVRSMIEKYFKIIAWSPDDTKILYQASQSGDLPIIIKPRRIGNNLLYEQRNLQEKSVYVYDIQEDVNTRIIENAPELCDISDSSCTEHPLSWFPDSDHLLFVDDNKIKIVEDDGSNMTTIYAGPFLDHYVYSWPDGSRLVILTNLNNDSIQPTLYTISLK